MDLVSFFEQTVFTDDRHLPPRAIVKQYTSASDRP